VRSRREEKTVERVLFEQGRKWKEHGEGIDEVEVDGGC
jgi:hypothetical protein